MAKKNLEGYVRKGKRFIPPLKQLPNMREHSYLNDMLPELIWLGLIHDCKGYKFGARALEVVVNTSKGWPAQEHKINYALQSAYKALKAEQKEELATAWKKMGLLDDIQHALAPLVLLYDGFALAFVGPPTTALSQELLIERLKRSVANHLNNRETPGIVLHGTMMLTRMLAGTIKIAAHIDLPDLNSVIERPESEEAKRAASFMRANSMAEMEMMELSPDWAKYFWNRSGELSKCEFPTYLAAEESQ